MSAAHTPGAWRVNTPMTGDDLVIEAQPSVDWHIVARVPPLKYIGGFDEMKANARLFAAAPQLVEALRKLESAATDTLKAHHLETSCCSVTRVACEEARAALAAAGAA